MMQHNRFDQSAPMAWEHRLYRLSGLPGLSVEIWNPITQAWERSPNTPHWPEAHEREAMEWIRLANEEQALRNSESAASLGF